MLIKTGYGLSCGQGKEGSGGGGPSYLDGVITSVVADLDATIAASYTSGDTWSNLIASPADGGNQTDYDFNRGAASTTDGDEPAFTGTVGDSGAYWAFNGTSAHFTIKNGNTTFINSLHKTTGGSDFWMAWAFYKNDDAQQLWFGGTEKSSDIGVTTFDNNTENVRLLQRGASASNTELLGAGTISLATPSILIVSHSHSTNESAAWYNTITGTTVAQTFSTSTSNPANPFNIMGRAGAATAPASTRLYHFSMGNEYLNDTKAGDIIAHLETRHARDYTP